MKKFFYLLLIFLISCNSGNNDKMNYSVDSLQIEKESVITDKISNNITGRLNYIMDDTMEVDIPSTISVSISNNMTKNDVIKLPIFKKNKILVDTIIRITPVMEVKLHEIGSHDFIVDTLTPTTQKIELQDTSITTWQWRVTPLNDGDKVLTLTVDIIIDGVRKNLSIYDGNIYVHMDNKILRTIENIFKSYWEFILTVIVIPIFIWVFNLYILPKMKKQE